MSQPSIGIAHDSDARVPSPVTRWSHAVQTRGSDAANTAKSDVRGVRELAEQAGDHERDLLADVHRVVADPLQGAGHEHHRHRPLARVLVGPDLHRATEDLSIEGVDLLV